MNRRARAVVLTLVLGAALTGCSEKRHVCEACMSDDPKVCAKSIGHAQRREEDARCGAAEALCATLNAKDFERVCKDRNHSVMFGCAREVVAQMRFECASSTHLRVPLLLDL